MKCYGNKVTHSTDLSYVCLTVCTTCDKKISKNDRNSAKLLGWRKLLKYCICFVKFIVVLLTPHSNIGCDQYWCLRAIGHYLNQWWLIVIRHNEIKIDEYQNATRNVWRSIEQNRYICHSPRKLFINLQSLPISYLLLEGECLEQYTRYNDI